MSSESLSEMTDEERTSYWNEKVSSELVGKTITAVRYFHQHESDFEGWSKRPVQIELDNVYVLIPMMDDEGNDGGSIATNIESLTTIPVL